MNEELKAELLSIVRATKETGMKAVEIVKEQAPILVEQILKYELLESVVIVLFLTALYMFVFKTNRWIFKRAGKESEKGYCSQNELIVGGGWAFIILSTAASFVTIFAIYIWEVMKFIKILVAPNLFLLEYVGKLIK